MAETLLITGPPGSGKTRAALESWGAEVLKGGGESVMLLLPNAVAVADAKGRLLRDDKSGVLDPRIMQFYALVAEILRSCGEDGREIGEGTKRFLIRRITSSMRDDGKLRHFRASSDLGGFAAAVSALIAELKQAAILPEAFERAVAGRGASPKDRELARIYAEYQRQLKRADLYDAEGKLWRVRDLIREGRLGRLGEVSTLIVDGFVNFTPAQFDIIEAFARRVEKLVVTLTLDESPDRAELFGTPRDTLEQFYASFGADLAHKTLPPRSTGAAALDRLSEELFSCHFAHDFTADAGYGAVVVIHAPGREAEIEEIAREAKRLIVQDGVDPSEIAILTHHGSRDPLIEETFNRHGVPVNFVGVRGLTQFPLVRRLGSVLRLLEGDGDPSVVFDLLRCGEQPAAADGDGPPTPDRIEQLCRLANVLGGRQEMLDGLRSLAGEHERRLLRPEAVFGEEPQDVCRAIVRDAGAAAEQLGRLFDLFDEIPRRATFARFCKTLRALLEKLSFFEPADAAEAEAAAALLGILADMETIDRLAPGAGSAWPLAELTAHLRGAVACTAVPRRMGAASGVRVITFTDARGLFFDHVFIPGMLEGEIPARTHGCPFYSDRERKKITAGGIITLKERQPGHRDGMFGFYTALTRARKSVVLSYPYVDSRGHPLVPSHYLEEVERLLTPPSGTPVLLRRRVGVEEIFPPYELAAKPDDLLGRVLADLWHGAGGGEAAGLYNASLLMASHPWADVAAKAAIARERDSSEPFGVYDGEIRDEMILARLAGEISSRPVSAGRLDRYLDCPYAFFAEQVLHVEPMPVPEPEITPLERGSLIHDILFEFYKRLRDRTSGRTTFTTAQAAGIESEMAAACENQFRIRTASGGIRPGGLWEVQRRLIVELMRRFIEAQALPEGETGGPEPAYFEITFGMGTRRDPSDPASVAEPLVIDLDEMKLAIRGSIDRIDLVDGGRGFRVLDYKTGRPHSGKSVKKGERLQLPIYLLAAESLIFKDRPDLHLHSADFIPLGGEVCEIRQKVGPAGRSKPAISGEEWEELRRLAVSKIQEVVRNIRGGRFSVDPHSTGGPLPCVTCPYRPICLYSEGRRARKGLRQSDI